MIDVTYLSWLIVRIACVSVCGTRGEQMWNVASRWVWGKGMWVFFVWFLFVWCFVSLKLFPNKKLRGRDAFRYLSQILPHPKLFCHGVSENSDFGFLFFWIYFLVLVFYFFSVFPFLQRYLTGRRYQSLICWPDRCWVVQDAWPEQKCLAKVKILTRWKKPKPWRWTHVHVDLAARDIAEAR